MHGIALTLSSMGAVNPVYKRGEEGRVLRNARGERIPIRNKWIVECYIDGKRVRKQVDGSKNDAQRVLAEIRLRGDLEVLGMDEVAQRVRPIDDLVDRYLAHQESHLKASSYRDVRQGLPRIVRALGIDRVGDITLELIRERRRRMKQSNRTRNKLIGHLKSCLQWAASEGEIADNPLRNLKPLPLVGHEKRKRRAMTADEIARILDAAERIDSSAHGAPRAPLLWLISYTGLRLGEAFRLNWEDLKGGVAFVRLTKNNRAKKVPMPEFLVDRLNRHRRELGKHMKRLPREDDAVIVGVRGGRCHPNATSVWRKFLWNVLDLAGVPRKVDGETVDFHAFRHTYCCMLFDQGVDEGTAAKLLGHTSIQMVRQVYGRQDRAPLEDAVSRLHAPKVKGPKAEESGR